MRKEQKTSNDRLNYHFAVHTCSELKFDELNENDELLNKMRIVKQKKNNNNSKALYSATAKTINEFTITVIQNPFKLFQFYVVSKQKNYETKSKEKPAQKKSTQVSA